jgi:uncharacterized protein (DUF2252 family)
MKMIQTLFFCVAFCGCGDVTEARRAWLQNTLIEDNFLQLQRSPELVAGKFSKMALNPFFFFRGTLGQFTRDLTAPGPGYLPTRYATFASSSIIVVGDPHPENIGTFLNPSGQHVVDFNDFDGVTYGPYFMDVRCLALSFFITSHEIGLSELQRDELILASVRGYTEEFTQLLSGSGPTLFREGHSGAILDDMLADAKEDGDAKKELVDFTRLVNGQRVMFFGELKTNSSVQDISLEERTQIEQVISGLPETLLQPLATSFAIKGISRRFGAGVASLLLLRYYVLIEGPTISAQGDILLEVKEVRDPPPYLSSFGAFPTKPFAHNAERIVSLTRQAQESPTNDLFLGFGISGAAALRVHQLTDHQKNINVSSLIEGFAGAISPSRI